MICQCRGSAETAPGAIESAKHGRGRQPLQVLPPRNWKKRSQTNGLLELKCRPKHPARGRDGMVIDGHSSAFNRNLARASQTAEGASRVRFEKEQSSLERIEVSHRDKNQRSARPQRCFTQSAQERQILNAIE